MTAFEAKAEKATSDVPLAVCPTPPSYRNSNSKGTR